MVHIDPERPWLMALSMGSTSSPSTSPTITRSAFIRSARRTRSETAISPRPRRWPAAPRAPPGRGAGRWSASRPSSRACSMVTMRSRGGTSAAKARSIVVLPEFMAPETTMFLRARTAAANRDGQLGTDRPEVDQVGQGESGVPVPTDGDGRSSGHRHHGREPAPVGKSQVHLRSGQVEPPLGQAEPAGRGPHHLDDLVVRSGDRRHQAFRPVGEGGPDPIAPVDVDVLDLGIVDQRLEAAHAEEGVQDRLGQEPLLVGISGQSHPTMGRRW